MKYDDASWHSGGDFPDDLPPNAGATHIAMFLSRAVLHGLGSEFHMQESEPELAALQSRGITPAEWFLTVCDGKFTSEDLTEEGTRFAATYYADANGLLTSPASYLSDYSSTFEDGDSLYHVPDIWASYDTLAPIIQSRFDAWKNLRRPA